MLLDAENIHKKFQSGDGFIEVLKGASLRLEKGDLSILSGQSGSGKSTFLYILAGLIRPDTGDIRFNGESVNDFIPEKLDHFRNSDIGFVFQMHHLMPDFTAVENVMIPALIKGISRNQSYESACQLLSDLSILHRKDHYPNQLSGGEQQRTAVARALINSPELLLADEPTGNLDEENAESLIKLIMKLVDTRGVGVLIATHNPDLAKAGKKLFRLSEGRIITLN
jgi:lipoprotein-releasing system ATP-binding protein